MTDSEPQSKHAGKRYVSEQAEHPARARIWMLQSTCMCARAHGQIKCPVSILNAAAVPVRLRASCARM